MVWSWSFVLALLLVMATAIGLGVGLGVGVRQSSPPSPSPTVTPSVLPSVTTTVSAVDPVKVLFHDQFAAATVPVRLSQHTPLAPAGATWLTSAAPFITTELFIATSGSAETYETTGTNPLIHWGSNTTSPFDSALYTPQTDILQFSVTFSVNTLPVTATDDGLLVSAILTNSANTADYFIFELLYTIGNGVDPQAPHYKFIAGIVQNNAGNRNNIADTGFIPGHPPLNSPLAVTFTIQPDGTCHVVCPQLSVDARGPTTAPYLVPSAGAVMNDLVLFAECAQDVASSATPLQARYSEVRVVAFPSA